MTEIEKPPNRELIKTVCCANLFQYSNDISIICCLCYSLLNIFNYWQKQTTSKKRHTFAFPNKST